MSKYDKDAKKLLDFIGGKSNIRAVSHCMTRMRFVLKDDKKADVNKIETLASVKGTFTQGGQFQVIIGNDVQVFYNDFITISGVEEISKGQVGNNAKDSQNWLQRLMGNLGEIFAPLIPALICGGLILGFRNIIGEITFFNNGTQTLADISQFWQGMYSFLWLIGEAVFHLLPVGIVWSITKKMKTTQILGIVLGLTLVSPQLLNGFEVASTASKDIPIWNFGFTQIQMIGYQGQVIAAMMAGFVLVYFERFFRKITPEVISMIIVPFCSLLPAVIIAHTIVGPIGWMIGNWIADVVYGGLTSSLGIIFAAVFGLIYAPIVMTGLHHMTNAIDTTLANMFGGTILWPMIALSNIAQGSSVLAMSILQKRNKKAQQINIPACISCYLGVTEPALFGVSLKYGFPLVCGMIGSSVAAVISVGFGIQAFSIGVGGLPGIISIKSQYWLIFLLAMTAAILIPFVLTYFIGKNKLTNKELGILEEKVDEAFISPMTGRLLKIEEVDDQVFASKTMGDGFAIELTEGLVRAPVSGEIIMAFPTKHAYGLKGNDGTELLIHIGMNTVELQGKGFESFVQTGDYVKQGDKLVKVDLNCVKEHGKSVVSPVIFTSGQKVKCLKADQIIEVKDKNIIEVINDEF